MSLLELISGVEAHEKTLTVFNADAETVESMRRQFRDRNVSIAVETTTSGQPSAFAVLGDDGGLVTAAPIDDILTPATEDPHQAAFTGDELTRPILDHLDETMFTSYDIDQMIAASREIEDRAWRVGAGTLHAGFQSLSILAEQLPGYQSLADRSGLAVHAYASPDGTVPSHDSELTIHIERSIEIERTWFVVYDGGGDDCYKCALVAEERERDCYYGFWTYDPDTVDWIIDHLEEQYGLVEPT